MGMVLAETTAIPGTTMASRLRKVTQATVLALVLASTVLLLLTASGMMARMAAGNGGPTQIDGTFRPASNADYSTGTSHTVAAQRPASAR